MNPLVADHWIIAPILIPALVAPALILLLRHSLNAQRLVSVGATALLAAVAIRNLVAAMSGPPEAYYLGAWPAPFGIVLVLDRLSASMVLLTAVLGLVVVVYAASGWDTRGRHFHPLFQFQLMGVNGAFLTGDVFNLFVFFEVMLIASYGLMLHGGGPVRLRAGFQYVAVNLIGSTLFLFAVGLIYAVTGTLNMADLAVKIAYVPPSDHAILKTGTLLLLVVFALKAALVPLQAWLPTAYAAASAPAAAIFMIMTKVGAYSIIRVHGLVYGEASGDLAFPAAPWIVPAALLTLVLGAAGALASRRLVDLACFATVWSMGSLLVSLGLFGRDGIAAALYYTVHGTLAGAALFLVVDLVVERRGRFADMLGATPPIAARGLVGGLFFVAAIAAAGMPPLSGFVGKLLILKASWPSAWGPWIWTVLLATSLVLILGFARAGSVLFWRSGADGAPVIDDDPGYGAGVRLAAVGALLVATFVLTAFSGPVTAHFRATAEQITDPRAYVSGVLGPEAADKLGVALVGRRP
jgi:multicomponent K+:H+ antiporter subunit D